MPTNNPILQTISLVEDRIGEIPESGDLELDIEPGEIPSKKWSDTLEKVKFLKQLSLDLHKFYDRQF